MHRIPDGPHELYDLREDPDERVNLADSEEHVPHRNSMRARLDEWFATYASPTRDGAHARVTGLGQRAPMGTGADDFVPFRDEPRHLPRPSNTPINEERTPA